MIQLLSNSVKGGRPIIMMHRKVTPKDTFGIMCFLVINLFLLVVSGAIPGSMSIWEQSICRNYFIFQIVINGFWLIRRYRSGNCHVPNNLAVWEVSWPIQTVFGIKQNQGLQRVTYHFQIAKPSFNSRRWSWKTTALSPFIRVRA